MTTTHLLSMADLRKDQVLRITERGRAFKAGEDTRPLAGKMVAMLFEKPSLRTRVSFDVGITQLGGHAIYLGGNEVGLGGREPVSDVARVLSRYVDGIIARVTEHRTLEELAEHGSVPVINALSEVEHPCQTLADLQTIREHHGHLEGITIAFVGDGNNVASSLALGAAYVGADFVIASPVGYELARQYGERARKAASTNKAGVRQVTSPEDAVTGADVVYTDVWVSMGNEAEAETRGAAFQSYQVTPELMKLANPGAIFMHDLPAHAGEEISEGMLEHPQSVVFDQAENRLHAQKAVLELVLGESRLEQ